MGRPSLLGRMFPSLGSQPRCCSRRRLGGSSVPLFSRASSRELVCVASRPPRPKDVKIGVTTRFSSESRQTPPHPTPPFLISRRCTLLSTSEPHFPVSTRPQYTPSHQETVSRNVRSVRRKCIEWPNHVKAVNRFIFGLIGTSLLVPRTNFAGWSSPRFGQVSGIGISSVSSYGAILRASADHCSWYRSRGHLPGLRRLIWAETPPLSRLFTLRRFAPRH